jgi:hypothetical protein
MTVILKISYFQTENNLGTDYPLHFQAQLFFKSFLEKYNVSYT